MKNLIETLYEAQRDGDVEVRLHHTIHAYELGGACIGRGSGYSKKEAESTCRASILRAEEANGGMFVGVGFKRIFALHLKKKGGLPFEIPFINEKDYDTPTHTYTKR